ncbi:MAG: peptidoglycan editing factor PgeF [Deinococcota bacterium]|jgi:YfiH family protein|nr:peptidoglycan editing factor PgeF [Deinococcota bacterium]
MTRSHTVSLIRAPNLGAPHGFSTRQGGVSEGAFAGLNLGLSSGDEPERVEENRRRFLAALDAVPERVCGLSQVHGARVLEAAPCWFEEEADASVSDDPGLLLVVGAADCFPLLFYDPRGGAVGAAHCGWRGSLEGVAAEVVAHMKGRYGSRPDDVRVAIGPGIRGPCYQVSAEVAEGFLARGFPPAVVAPDGPGHYRLDLAGVNRAALIAAGVRAAHIWDSGLCTHCDATRFYSHRRDRGKTGRLWAAIRLAKG